MSVPSFGIVTHAVGHPPMPFETALKLIQETTAEHILLLSSPDAPPVKPGVEASSHYPNALESDAELLKSTVANHGLQIGGLLPFVRPLAGSDQEANESIDSLTPWVAAAARIGTSNLVLSSPPPPGPESSFEDKQPLLSRTAGILDALVAVSNDPLFTVTVDIHRGALVETVADAQYLVGQTRKAGSGLLLNIGHLTTCRQDGWRLVEENGDKIFTVGWKDHSLAEDRPNPVYSVELGTADSPFEKYVHAFKQIDSSRVTHFVNVEHPPLGEEVPVLQRSYAYMRNLWQTVE
ncbi:MAG: sugar phosphate isomerase/epimerase family protein [Thermomicrobiales bacterium]